MVAKPAKWKVEDKKSAWSTIIMHTTHLQCAALVVYGLFAFYIGLRLL